MNEFTISHARREIIASLNSYGEKFPESKKDVFYYDNILKYFTIDGLLK